MERNIQLSPALPSERGAIIALYRAAFPRNERKPLCLLRRQQKQGYSETLSIRDGERFLGMIILVNYRDMSLIDFFAVEPSARSGGVGGKVLTLLKERYGDRRLFLEIERVTPDAPNREERARRLAFYLRNGMTQTGVHMRIYGSDMELMHAASPVGYEDYIALLRATLGPLYYRIIRPVIRA